MNDNLCSRNFICVFIVFLAFSNEKVFSQNTSLECNFEAEFSTEQCKWSTTSNLKWIRQNGESVKHGTGPSSDVTTKNSYGYYGYVNSFKNALGSATLTSQTFTIKDAACLEFYYQVAGAISPELSLKITDKVNDIVTVLWERQGSRFDSWRHAYVNILPGNNLKEIEFSTTINDTFSGYVALDEIKLLNGQCPTSQLCDFESSDICGFRNLLGVGLGKFSWIRNKGKGPQLNSGPSFDHTYQTPQGYYMYIVSEVSRFPSDTAILVSKVIQKNENICLRFWYHAYGSSIGVLSVYKRINGRFSGPPIWRLEGEQGNVWRPTQVSISESEDFEIAFEVTNGKGSDGDYAIDDVYIDTTSKCRSPASCNFEESLCLWTEDTLNDFNMFRINSQQLSNVIQDSSVSFFNSSQYILADATTNTKYGHFLWISPNFYPNVGLNKSSTLISETIFYQNYANGACFSFAYYLNGLNLEDPGTITIYVKMYSTLKQKLFSVNGNKGSTWKFANVDIKGPITKNFEIYVEVVLENVVGNIALDDFYLYDHPCNSLTTTPSPNSPFACGDGTTITYDKVCNFIKDCENGNDESVCGDCDFENSTCKYKDISDGSYKWTRIRADSSQGFGPAIDNTLSSSKGHYVFVQSSSGSFYFLQVNLELQQLLKPSSSSCELEFYYYITDKVDEINVFLNDGFDYYDYTLLYSIYGNSENQWKRFIIRLGRIYKPFRLEFAASRNYGSKNLPIALDDIKLRDCQFPPVSETGCLPTEFTCARKACIPLNQVCDLTDDCGDNSDELNCGDYTMCDFENGLCNWKNDPAAELDWYIEWGLNDPDTGPDRDHTTGTNDGRYLLMSAFLEDKGERARFISPVYRKINDNCDLRLFYHMYGKDIGELNIYYRTNIGGGETKLFYKDYELGNFWERADIPINITDPFQIIIEGVVGNGNQGDIGIDDITLTPGCKMDTSIVLPTVTTFTTVTTTNACSGQFTCKSTSKCVPLDKVCNFNDECGDNSDEADCGTCDFETSWCGYYDQSSGEIIWNRRQAPSINPNGPQIDHTLNNSGGSFLVTEKTANIFYDEVILKGPKMQATSKFCKFGFWIHMDTTLNSSVYIYYANFSNNDDFEYIGNVNGPLGNQWVYREFSLGSFPANYHIGFLSYPEIDSQTYYADIGLDDVAFINCGIEVIVKDKTLDCDFDKNFCDYFIDETSSFKWKIESTSYYYDTGPQVDHTTGYGQFAYMPTAYPQQKGNKARFHSSIQTSVNQDFCFEFWYFMYGKKLDSLNVYLDQHPTGSINDNVNRTLIWKKTDTQGRKWFQAKVNINSKSQWKLTFEGTVGLESSSDIAIDDTLLANGKCPSAKLCDFEVDACEYKNDFTAEINWIRGRTIQFQTDHTTNTNYGFYMFVDLKGGSINSKARFISPTFLPIGVECLEFWYLNSGKNSGRLNIYQNNQNVLGTALWSRSSHENQEFWRYGQVTIGNDSENNEYSIVFEGVKLGDDSNAIIAIDDIIAKNGECQLPVHCNFEEFNLCSWTQYKGNDLDWELSQGDVNIYGPSIDVTTGTQDGVYIFIDSNYPTKINDEAKLVSDFIDPITDGCFGVWYYMEKWSSNAIFSVYLNDSTNQMRLINKISGSQGDIWNHLELKVTSLKEFNIVLEGKIGDDFLSDLALDDITFYRRNCENKEGSENQNQPKKNNTGLIVGLTIPIVLIFIISLAAFVYKLKFRKISGIRFLFSKSEGLNDNYILKAEKSDKSFTNPIFE